MTLAALLPNSHVVLTDLPEAREIVERNIASTELRNGSTLAFEELDWDDQLPAWLTRLQAKTRTDLVLASDCTYNADSRYLPPPLFLPLLFIPSASSFSTLTHVSPALVHTLRRLADTNSQITVAIAMKMRHDSERVFFDLMHDAGFAETALLDWALPGDVSLGEEKVYLHVYRLAE